MNNVLNVLFKEEEQIVGKTFCIIDIFDNTMFVSQELLRESFNREEYSECENFLEFNSIEKLGHFALEVCKKMRLKECYLLSRKEYNKAFQFNINSASDLDHIFEKFGTKVSLAKESQPKSVFERLFK
ncbi:MAG: hypothetical protein N4A33_02565 [Bacteriovoracaceae bacterium]|jgi:hypothetical protein|nr:hypothetical protein [Bacteriovoracaceae bacterium]